MAVPSASSILETLFARTDVSLVLPGGLYRTPRRVPLFSMALNSHSNPCPEM
jgi:hypothetical protein